MSELKISLQKPMSTYVAFALMDLNKGEKVILKGIGRAIQRVVDVAEVLKRRASVVVETINIASIEQDGRKKSYIEIVLAPQKSQN